MPLKDLYRMAVFAKIVEQGSLSAAATALGLAKSAVSQHLNMLEASLNTRLINRTTRALVLTEEGRAYYESCARIVAEAERAEQSLDGARTGERGKVRLTCSYNLGISFVVPAIPEFHRLYPDVTIDLVLEDRVLNVIDAGIDVSLRSGWLTDSTLFAVTLAPMRMVICASAGYVASHPPPLKPEDICQHSWIGISGVLSPDRLALEQDGGARMTVALQTRLHVNSGFAARALILLGLGIGMQPDYAVTQAIACGELVRLCAPWRSKVGAVSAVFPSKQHLSRRNRLLIDFLRARLATAIMAESGGTYADAQDPPGPAGRAGRQVG